MKIAALKDHQLAWSFILEFRYPYSAFFFQVPVGGDIAQITSVLAVAKGYSQMFIVFYLTKYTQRALYKSGDPIIGEA